MMKKVLRIDVVLRIYIECENMGIDSIMYIYIYIYYKYYNIYIYTYHRS